MSDSESDSPMDIDAAAEAALAGLLPQKSKDLYEAAYKKFEDWCTRNKIRSIEEKTMLAYFASEMANRKPSTTWTQYSMLKATISLKKNVNIGGFSNLIALLKRKADGYRPKKSKILTKEQIFKFLKDADNKQYLAAKVVLIVGVYGACRRDEILKLTVQDIEDMEGQIKITIPNTKTKILRQFVITKGNAPGVDMLELFRTYAKMRPACFTCNRFFLGYRNGKCMKQVMGINIIGAVPRTIAQFLKLASPNEFTGHCFRRSSASILADTGVDVSILKRHGGWKSTTVAEGYVEHSLQQKKQVAEKMFGASDENLDSNDSHEKQTAAFIASDENADSNDSHENLVPIGNIAPVCCEVNPVGFAAPTVPEFNFSAATTSSASIHMNNLSGCTINFYSNK